VPSPCSIRRRSRTVWLTASEPVVAASTGQPIGVEGADEACLLRIPPYTGATEDGGTEVGAAEVGGFVAVIVVAAGAKEVTGALEVVVADVVAVIEEVVLVGADVVVDAADEQAVSKTATTITKAMGMKMFRDDIFFTPFFFIDLTLQSQSTVIVSRSNKKPHC
jgi:hypothetical protein